MLFYNFELRWNDYNPRTMSALHRTKSEFDYNYTENTVEAINDGFYGDYSLNEDKMLFVTECKDGIVSVYVAAKVGCYREDEIREILLDTFPDCSVHRIHEITVDEYKRNLEMSQFYSGRKALKKLSLDYRSSSLYDPCPYEWKEQVMELPKMSKSEAKKRSAKILASKSFSDELGRIYSSKNIKEYYGHPVHYLISAGDWGAARDMYELLIRALASNGRLCSNRLSIFRGFRKGAYRDERYTQHLSVSEGGIVVMELCSDSAQGRFASDFHEFTKVTGNMLEELKKDTLFIFVEIMGKSLKNADSLGSIISKADFIQLTEGSGTYEQAKEYLLELSGKSDIRADDDSEVTACLPERESYTVTDIFTAFNSWYGSGLKNHIYKAYKKEDCCRVEITEAVSRPYEDLRELVGLDGVKAVIDQIVSAGKVKCLRENMGLKTEASSLNMMFAGNPGTAKTTVARLLAQILKDEDVIRSGKLVECGRQDLVGRYVGWTAKIIEEKFREASGGILFIDEAYSLVDDSNTYGAEAINTITQLMENYRDSVIVIFAGYPDKMKTFLEQNEGLRSRIAFHLNFPDYTADQLFEILSLHARRREYSISEEAEGVCRRLLAQAREQVNYGNGRYVRNLLEQAIIRQSGRLLSESAGGELSAEEMCLLKPEDFREVTLGVLDENEVKLGFAI